MKYIFRGVTVFEYDPETKVIQEGEVHSTIPAFNYCRFIAEDYSLLSIFFKRVHAHMTGIMDAKDLTDIEVY